MQVLNNQTLLDLSIQESGTADNWLLIAMENNKVPTAELTAGENIVLPVFTESNTEVVNFLSIYKVFPATANTISELVAVPQLTCQEEVENCFKDIE